MDFNGLLSDSEIAELQRRITQAPPTADVVRGAAEDDAIAMRMGAIECAACAEIGWVCGGDSVLEQPTAIGGAWHHPRCPLVLAMGASDAMGAGENVAAVAAAFDAEAQKERALGDAAEKDGKIDEAQGHWSKSAQFARQRDIVLGKVAAKADEDWEGLPGSPLADKAAKAAAKPPPPPKKVAAAVKKALPPAAAAPEEKGGDVSLWDWFKSKSPVEGLDPKKAAEALAKDEYTVLAPPESPIRVATKAAAIGALGVAGFYLLKKVILK